MVMTSIFKLLCQRNRLIYHCARDKSIHLQEIKPPSYCVRMSNLISFYNNFKLPISWQQCECILCSLSLITIMNFKTLSYIVKTSDGFLNQNSFHLKFFSNLIKCCPFIERDNVLRSI